MNIADRTLVTSYAQALFGAASAKGVLEEVAPQADRLGGLVDADVRLRTFMNAPNISREEKENLLTRAFSGRFNELLVNFLRLLVRRGRLNLMSDTLREFHALYLESKGIAEGRVVTAVELSEAEKAELEKSLNGYTGKKLQLKYSTDPKVLGGVRFQSGDLLIENTLSMGLSRLEQTLRKARVY
jgi:F-type H+-transporting ATPase subunit delta